MCLQPSRRHPMNVVQLVSTSGVAVRKIGCSQRVLSLCLGEKFLLKDYSFVSLLSHDRYFRNTPLVLSQVAACSH